MSNKRSRDSLSSSALAKDIRNTLEDVSSQHEIESRTKYIKQQLDSMSEDQLTRFEFFVRSHLPRARVKDIITNALGAKYNITDEMAIVVCGLAKLFVGEITEIATDVMKETGGEEGIKVEYIEEAYRRLQQDGKIGSLPDRAYLFSKSSMVVSDYGDADLFENPEGLEALLSEPTTILSKRNKVEDTNNEGEEEPSGDIHDYNVVGGEA
eukprot:CAMPEP_0184985702 /NCGR_PEP_ID=MMETSP1098-20130426/14253_1 /TAXON_ID=89044 /ORGANISM="Spumella elongata, Strain CCAP 955/1" /LENGTH=209 /DNA_ID=CAMNT_0027509799 /DNA_START=33 /DNA_END=659 /DNA_ORIENTATION=-